MAQRNVTYRKQVEAKGENVAPVAVDEAVSLIKKMASVKVDRTYKNGRRRKAKDHTVDIVLHLGIDPKQADQMLRGAISLPKGIGKSRSVIAFCDANTAEAAKAAGAKEAGAEELVAKVEGAGRFRRSHRPPQIRKGSKAWPRVGPTGQNADTQVRHRHAGYRERREGVRGGPHRVS
jgi:large subunit ribosomal protein L1